MKTISYRVTPVTRWNLTERWDDPAENGAGVCQVGEFDSQRTAEIVGRALAAQTPGAKFTPMDGETEQTPYRQWLAVERNFSAEAEVAYFDNETLAQAFVLTEQLERQREFRIFSRAITDPVAAARASTDPAVVGT